MNRNQPTTAVPTLPEKSQFPGWVAAEQKLNELRMKLQEVERRVNEVQNSTIDSKTAIGQGVDAVLQAKRLPELPSYDQYAGELRQLRYELKVLREAIVRQEETVRRERHKASCLAADLIHERHLRLIRRRAELVRALAESNDEERLLIWELERREFTSASYRRPMMFMLGSISLVERSSNAVVFLQECKEYFGIEV